MLNELDSEMQRLPAAAGANGMDDLAADGTDTRSSDAGARLPIAEEWLICEEWIYFETC